MKVIWICNAPVYLADNPKRSTRGGWMEGAMRAINGRVSLVVYYPDNSYHEDEIKNIKYKSFLSRNREDFFCEEYEYVKPDIIHIWGTEYSHTLDAVKASEKMGLIDKTVINMQGVMSVCSKLFGKDIPKRYFRINSLLELVVGNYLTNSLHDMENMAIYEQEALRKVKNVIGRTDWDQCVAKKYSKEVEYYFLNETLREKFYDAKKWDYDSCEKHSIFVSQGENCIKGLHVLLEALVEVKKYFPDVMLYIIGRDFRQPHFNRRFMQRLARIIPSGWLIGSYGKYIRDIVNREGLEDNIVFVGELTEDEMIKRFQKANVVVSSSIIENESNTISEARLVGVPVVSSYVGGVTGRICHGVDGFFYPYNEPDMLAYYIMKIFNNIDLAMEMSRKGITSISKIVDFEKNKKRLIEIYEDICKG